ncbi:cellulose 1,4-beta-cellobiosidase CelS [Acetivibrio mesophilus]|uniref:Endoglucanase n=1 Tax=Acetivibrio mesophilus TaxID=2487273 RepID=A0A4V1K275_9FIRM|nr:cellulose 1,4-beta-cellobiosidase CelS [Acetivibrio mesophilus]RXE59309.1 endoglucanase [Acetivibrio mesophilus]
MVKSRKISILLAIAMLVSIMIPSTALAGPIKAPTPGGTSYEDLFLEFYDMIKDPRNGYFSSDEGIPYHSIETLIVEAPDYGHVTTSEAFSYYIWLEAMYGQFTGDWSGVKESWQVMEDWIIPDSTEQPGMAMYSPNSPATYAAEHDDPKYYPSELMFDSVRVGTDPIHNDLTSAYGPDMYLMHWLMDVDNWYGFGTGTRATFINTFQRGEQESAWETIPHPSIEEFKYGGPNGFLDLFTKDKSYSKQWRYTNAPDAEARAIQAAYWANKWAKEQGKASTLSSVVTKATKMGDFLRNDMFDKYFMKIGAQDKTPGTGYDSAHYLMAWYTSWGGGIGSQWAWKIGASHIHFGYQNPFQAWINATQSEFAPKSSNGKKDWTTSLDRQIEFYQWLQSAEGAIAGGATNSWKGRYEKYPAGKSTFYGMAYVPHPVYADPGSNEWFGMQCWSMQRMMDLYLESGDSRIEPLVRKWAEWAMSEVKLYEDGTFAIPSNLGWSGEPDTWTGKYTGNPNLHVTVNTYGTDLGVAGSLANALATYAAATRKWGTLDTRARDMAAELVNRAWYNYYCEEGKGVVTEEARGDYKRFFSQEVFVPAGWSGTMPNGDKIQPGVKFIDIRSKYKQDPDYNKVYQAYQRGEDPVLNYHRFWHEVDLAVGMGVLATYFPELTYQIPGEGGPGNDPTYGDCNEDGKVTSTDLTILKRYLLKMDVKINLENADVNRDGKVTSTDATILKRFLTKIIKELPL